MTAFNEILTAEEEALKSIETTKEEVANAVSEARAERRVRIDAETTKLEEMDKKELTAHESVIKNAAEKIQVEVNDQISAIEKRFDTHASDLKEELKKNFA